jgi:hypothetical protein
MAYTLIETVTVGSGGASSIEFTGIAEEAGADLVVRLSSRAANGLYNMTFNSDTAANYAYKILRGTDTVASSIGSDAQSYIRFYGVTETTQTANTFGSVEILISNYASSADKSVSIDGVSEHNGETGTSYRNIAAGKYTTSSAITSISFSANGGTISEHSTASLYLVTTADASGATIPVPKATGGSISLAGGYWIHSFTSSGTFTPTEDLTGVEYVVLAGGGAGGGNWGGGGAAGAGGYRSSVIGENSGKNSSAEATVSATASTGYAVTVGAGASQVQFDRGATGSTSSAFGITSSGGGGGGRGGDNQSGSSGGSGGAGGSKSVFGGNYTTGSGGSFASGTEGQGYQGGTGGNLSTNGTNQRGGGGGGAGASGNFYNNGDVLGGNGLTTNITGSALLMAGGGQGGFFYQGTPAVMSDIYGGGQGSNGRSGYTRGAGSGTYAKGAGGGGGCDPYAGGNGGSGIVIVRYAA